MSKPTCIVVLLALLSPIRARAATLSVGLGQPYGTIQAALTDAVDGDVIEIEAGTWAESPTVTKDVSIVGLGGSPATILAGNLVITGANVAVQGLSIEPPSGRGILVESSTATFSEFAVRGVDSQTFIGGPMRAWDSNVTLTDCLFEQNASIDGGAMSFATSTATVERCAFVGNAGGSGGGALSSDRSTVQITDSSFVGNTSQEGGAIQAFDGSSIEIVRSTFEANEAIERGGALYCKTFSLPTSCSIVGSTFTGNHATDASGLGGAISVRGARASVVSSTFVANTASQDGGAIHHMDGPSLDVIQSTFLDNESDLGGAIASTESYDGQITVSIAQSTFQGNVGRVGAGAIHVRPDTFLVELNARIDHNRFLTNVAPIDGGVVQFAGVTEGSASGNTFCGGTTSGFVLGPHLPGVGSAGPVALINNTFVGNAGPAVSGMSAPLTLTNNVFAWTADGSAVTSDTPVTMDHNLWFANLPGDLAGALTPADLGPHDVFAEPMFVAWTDDGDCGNDDLTPAVGSPLVDAGDPTIPDGDCSVSDIGATGGLLPGDAPDCDQDGFPVEVDCDDANAAIHPDAIESCNGIDDDCDDETDEAGATGEQMWFADWDDDGWGDDASTVLACDAPEQHVAVGEDCQDRAPGIHPGAPELCDGVDNDCNDVIDGSEALDATPWFADGDGDGHGAGEEVLDCWAPAGHVDNATDCDDTRSNVFDGAEELCDGLDNDCDDVIDGPEALDATPWFADGDGDGQGAGEEVLDCWAPAGHVDNADDCDDTRSNVFVGAEELCDGVDNDCDDVGDSPSCDVAGAGRAECGCDSTGSTGGAWALIACLAVALRRGRRAS